MSFATKTASAQALDPNVGVGSPLSPRVEPASLASPKDSMISQQLDLRVNGYLDDTQSKVYNKFSSDIRGDFSDFVGSLLPGPIENNIDWWLEAPASRNPIFSQLFHQLVSLLTLRTLIEIGCKYDSVIVDSTEMSALVNDIAKNHDLDLKIKYPRPLSRVKASLRSILSPYRSMARLTTEWIVVRSTSSLKAPAAGVDGPLILIDTFAIPGFIDDDRYYPGLYEHAGNVKNSIRFVPQFFNLTLSELSTASRLLRTQSNKYLLKEDLLTFRDLRWCFGHLKRTKKLKIPPCRFRGLEVTSLVRADIKRRAAFRCAVRGLMNYRFAKRLKDLGFCISKSIDWFENHPMDRGWNAGFNTFFPGSRRAGYTGFYPAGQSYRPTIHELNAGVLPPTHLLLGDGFKDDLREFHPDCHIQTAPAFRYQYLPNLDSREPDPDLMLVAMPYYPEMCSQVIRIVAELQRKQKSWKFIVKPHPAQPITSIDGYADLSTESTEITDQKISDLLNRCAIMLTGAQASTILEAAACAVPTLIIADAASSRHISVPIAVPEEMYRTCGDVVEAEKAMIELLGSNTSSMSAWHEISSGFRERCFLPVTDESVAKMLLA